MSEVNFKRPASQFAVHKDSILEKVEAGILLKEIFNELVDEKKFTGEYSNFCRLVKKEKIRKEQGSRTPISEKKGETNDVKKENNSKNKKNLQMFLNDPLSKK